MSQRPDITKRQDIDQLVSDFYRQAINDSQIGFIFTDIAKINLDDHLPIIADFWDMILLGGTGYQSSGSNPVEVHRRLHQQEQLTAEHFERWLELWRGCVQDNFSGPNADHACYRAQVIAASIRCQL